MSADKSIFDLIYGLSHENGFVDWLFVFAAQYLTYLIVVVALIYLLFKAGSFKDKVSIFLRGTLAVIISRGILTEIVRFFIERPRPLNDPAVQALISHDPASSFPSGHMAFLVPIAFMIFTLNKKLGIWLGVLTLIVGFSRIASGVHYPLDIFGGIVIGVIGFYFTQLILRKTS